MYQLLKTILFRFDPEKIHYFVTGALQSAQKVWGLPKLLKASFKLEHPSLEKEVFGLKFKNPVGLAAGFDKNGDYIAELSNFGFGFIEVGTVTPLPQPGNDKPRMFRLPKDEALINRMGFNNKGVDVLARKLENINREGLIIGGNIGKNKNTPNEDAVKDYVKRFDRLFDVVDYFVVNVSSPNTPGLENFKKKSL